MISIKVRGWNGSMKRKINKSFYLLWSFWNTFSHLWPYLYFIKHLFSIFLSLIFSHSFSQTTKIHFLCFFLLFSDKSVSFEKSVSFSDDIQGVPKSHSPQHLGKSMSLKITSVWFYFCYCLIFYNYSIQQHFIWLILS